MSASLLPLSEVFEFLSIPLQTLTTKSPALLQIRKHFSSSIRFLLFFFLWLGNRAFHPLGGAHISLLVVITVAPWPVAHQGFAQEVCFEAVAMCAN